MKNKFAAIPTTYKGINFRSRIEAKWAALFDLLKWDWEYEPYDLNGWIPDFKIKGNKDILVEVKSYSVYQAFPEIDDRWLTQLEKITKADPDLPVLLLSNSPIDNESNRVDGCFGIIFKKYDEWTLDVDSLDELILANGIPPFLTEDAPYFYKPTYSVKGESMASFEEMNREKLVDLWNQAGNITQWKGNR